MPICSRVSDTITGMREKWAPGIAMSVARGFAMHGNLKAEVGIAPPLHKGIMPRSSANATKKLDIQTRTFTAEEVAADLAVAMVIIKNLNRRIQDAIEIVNSVYIQDDRFGVNRLRAALTLSREYNAIPREEDTYE